MKYRFPVEWKIQSFKKIADVVTGTTPSTNHPEYYGNSIPFIGPSELGGIEPIIKSTKNLSDEGAKQARLLPRESVLVCCIGATIGKVGFAGTELATNQQINALVCNKNIVFPRYVFHYCQTLISLFRHEGASTTLPLLPKGRFQEIEIPVPPIAEQKRIAEILDRTQSLISKRKEAIAKLDTLTQSIFIEMFGDLVKNTKGWIKKPLSSLVKHGDTINYGVVQPGDDFEGGVPLIRVGDIVSEKVKLQSLKYIDPVIEASYKRSRLCGDEILISCVGTIGAVALADDSLKGFNIARAVARIPLATTINRLFVATYLRTEFVQRYFISELRTVSQPTLNIKQISETMIILPPLPLQKEFAQRVEAVEKLKATHRASLRQLEALFASLQHRAFRGEL